jgi:hypothetical protein
MTTLAIPLATDRVFSHRLWAKVDRSVGLDACWLWTGAKARRYGKIGAPHSRRLLLVHRVVATWALGPCPEGMECRHLCGVRACCNPLRLVWGTPTENQADRVRHGTHELGERNAMAKLRESDVFEIRAACESGEMQKNIADRYQISQPNVSSIAARKNWGWLV